MLYLIGALGILYPQELLGFSAELDSRLVKTNAYKEREGYLVWQWKMAVLMEVSEFGLAVEHWGGLDCVGGGGTLCTKNICYHSFYWFYNDICAYILPRVNFRSSANDDEEDVIMLVVA